MGVRRGVTLDNTLKMFCCGKAGHRRRELSRKRFVALFLRCKILARLYGNRVGERGAGCQSEVLRR